MAGASILLDIHCCSQVGRELMVDMNTQPDTEKDTSFTTTTTTTTTKNVKVISYAAITQLRPCGDTLQSLYAK